MTLLRKIVGGMKENKRKAKDNLTRPSDDQKRQPKIWTTERNGTTNLASVDTAAKDTRLSIND